MNFVQQKQLFNMEQTVHEGFKILEWLPFPKSCFLAVHEELAQESGGSLLGEVRVEGPDRLP